MKKKKLYLTLVNFVFIPVLFSNYVHGHPAYLPDLPAELWYKIASFLPGNDPALHWFLEFLVLTDTQADSWIKKYHRDTNGKNPLTFFAAYPTVKQAWLRFHQRRKAIKQALIDNDRDTIQHYLETEYTTLLDACIQATPQQLISFKTDICYALTCLEKYYYMAKNQTTKTLPLQTLKAIQQFIGLLSFTICGFTFIVTLITYNTNNNALKKLAYLKCLNGTTAYDEGLYAYTEKQTTCKKYASQLTIDYKYIPLVSVTALLLLLNSALFFYIRSISLKHQVTQEIKHLIMSYYNQLKAHEDCIANLI